MILCVLVYAYNQTLVMGFTPFDHYKNGRKVQGMMELKFAILDEMNRRFPQHELNYRNMIVASIIAKGKSDKLTEDWLRKTFLGDVEDGFIEYGQAVYIKDAYYKAMCEVKAMFA